MTVRGDDDKINQGYESGHGAYSKTPEGTAESLKDAENSSAGPYADTNQDESSNNDPANAARDSVNSREADTSSGSGGWAVNRSPNGFKFEPKGSFAVNVVKKGGPAGIIFSALLGMAGVVSFFGGPGLLIVNFVEQYTGAFNTQLASMDARMSRIVRAKLENTTKGCAIPKSPLCKFSTFSETELANFEKNKLTPLEKKQTITGRYKISGFELESGERISAKDFSKRMKSDLNFRNSITKSYGGVGGLKLAGTWDKVANAYKTKHGINFARPFKKGSTDEDRLKVVDDLSKGTPQTAGTIANSCDGRTPACTEAERNKANEDVAEATKRMDDVAKVGELSTPEESASSKVGSGAGGFASTVKAFGILGAADSACAFIGFSRNVGQVSKTTRLRQMLLFSTLFLTMHSMIKAGDAEAQDVSFVGDMLTQTFTDDGGVTTQAATDSFGYRNAAYGDTGIDEAASPFTIGASYGGEASGAMQQAIELLTAGGTAAGSIYAIKKICDFVNNPLVVAGSLITGIGALFLPGVNAGKVLGQIAVSGAFIAAQAIMLAKLADITKGVLVGKKDSRVAVGNIMNPATSSLLMGMGNSGGNPILTKNQAETVLANYEETKLAYAKMDRLNMSPFDPTSESTFVGSIYARVAPLIAKSSSISGTFASIFSINSSIAKNLIPSHASAVALKDGCEVQDPDVADAGYATTEFCVPYTGTPPEYLDIDPMVVAEYLMTNGYVDRETGEFTEAAQPFIETCPQRDTDTMPYGYSGEKMDKDNGKGCLIDDTKVSYFSPSGGALVKPVGDAISEVEDMSADTKLAIYLHTQDRRNSDILEYGLPDPTSSTETDTGTGQTTNGGYALPLDQKWYDENPVWFSKPHHDYPAADIPVPTGTPVYSMSAGRVTGAPNEGGYGQGVTIMGDDGVQYNYGHGSDGGLIVKPGDTVKAGQLIMHSANTGHSFGAHLHIDMRIDGIKHCPQNLLVALGKKLPTLPTPASLPTSGCSN